MAKLSSDEYLFTVEARRGTSGVKRLTFPARGSGHVAWPVAGRFRTWRALGNPPGQQQASADERATGWRRLAIGLPRSTGAPSCSDLRAVAGPRHPRAKSRKYPAASSPAEFAPSSSTPIPRNGSGDFRCQNPEAGVKHAPLTRALLHDIFAHADMFNRALHRHCDDKRRCPGGNVPQAVLALISRRTTASYPLSLVVTK